MKRFSSLLVMVVSVSLLCSALPLMAQLRLFAPNGSENLTAGSSFLIRWGGGNFSDTVSLDFSSDAGTSWKPIVSNITGVSYTWNPVPSLTSAQCLVRVTKNSTQTSGILHLKPTDNIRGGYVEFSPDDTRALTSNGHELHLYNSSTGQELWKTQVFFNAVPNFTTTGIAHFALGGTRIIVWVINELSGDTLHLLDAATGAELSHWSAGISKNWRYPLDFFNHVFYADVSQDGTKIAVSQFDTIHVFDIATEKLLNVHGTAASGSTIPFIKWTPDGKFLAAANASGVNSSVRIIDATTGAIISNFTGHPYGITRIKFSNDGTSMAVVSLRGDSSAVDIWDVTTGTRRGSLRSARYYQDVVFSPDGTQFLTTDVRTNPAFARWWDSQTLAPLSILGTRDFLGDLDVSNDGKRVLAGATTGAVIFGPPTALPGAADTSDNFFTIRSPISDTSLLLSIDSISANSNEMIQFKVRLQAGKSVDFTGVTGITGNISFNSTLLEPMNPTPKGIITQNLHTIAWQIPGQILHAPLDTIVSLLPFRTGLGNDSTTPLAWSNVTALGAAKVIQTQNGILRLDDICREGTSPRLITSSPNTTLTIRPSDITEQTSTLTFRTNEYGNTNIRLYNSLGIEVVTLVNESLALGEHHRAFTTESIANGIYYLVMTTPTERCTTHMRIVR